MKKNLYLIISIISVIIIASGIYIYADDTIDASDLGYNGGTVEEAIDTLYEKAAKSCQNVAGNKTTIGTKYYCDLGDGVVRGMYVFKVNTDTVELLFEKNLVNGINYTDAMAYFNEGSAGYTLKESWMIVRSVSLPDASDIAAAVNYSEWDITTAAQGSYFYFGTHSINDNASLNNQYSWLSNYLYGCNGCDISESSDISQYYWTKNLIASRNDFAWCVGQSRLQNTNISPSNVANYALRPVVVVSKSDLS